MKNKEFDYQGKRPDQVRASESIGGFFLIASVVVMFIFLIRLLIKL